MIAAKPLSLKDVGRNPRLLGRFIKERIHSGDGVGDRLEFDATITSMVRNSKPSEQTSTPANDACCSGTQTRPDTSKDAS